MDAPGSDAEALIPRPSIPPPAGAALDSIGVMPEGRPRARLRFLAAAAVVAVGLGLWALTGAELSGPRSGAEPGSGRGEPPPPGSTLTADSRPSTAERVEVPALAAPTARSVPPQATPPPFEVSLVVLAPDAEPVAEAEIEVTTIDEQPLLRTQSGHLGRIRVRLDRERAVVRARKAGVGVSGPTILTADDAKAEPGDRILRLVALVPVRGTVWYGGTRLAGAHVVIQGHNPGPSVAPVRSGAEGKFEVLVPAPGQWQAWASHFEHRSAPVDVRTTVDSRTDLELRIRRKITITGRVFDSRGAPAAKASVSALRADAVIAETSCDAAGRFEFGLEAPDDYTLVATSPLDARSLPRPIQLADDAPPPEIPLWLTAGWELRGVVEHADGTPIRGAALSLDSDEPGFHPLLALRAARRETSGADGRFRFRGLHPDWRGALLCVPFGERRLLSYVREGLSAATPEVRLVVRSADLLTATLELELVDAGGTPLHSARVTLLCNGQALDTEVQAGRLRQGGLPRGREISARVWLAGLQGFRAGPWLLDQELVRQRVAVPRPGSIQVRVLDADGQPLAGAQLRLAPAARAGGGSMQVTGTRSDGIAMLEGLLAPVYVLHFGRAQELEITLAPGERREVEVRIQ